MDGQLLKHGRVDRVVNSSARPVLRRYALSPRRRTRMLPAPTLKAAKGRLDRPFSRVADAARACLGSSRLLAQLPHCRKPGTPFAGRHVAIPAHAMAGCGGGAYLLFHLRKGIDHLPRCTASLAEVILLLLLKGATVVITGGNFLLPALVLRAACTVFHLVRIGLSSLRHREIFHVGSTGPVSLRVVLLECGGLLVTRGTCEGCDLAMTGRAVLVAH
mmetsp:Transcript_8454/g.31235  ORF Transcript_8454/g.31235 Transcript_8454/m.31235 type:complete len:217 (-) Transcript_8454:1454-2104(-)|eukprot:scaffold1824_cov332-Prasinococcus_capsulatus_cf.AAC.3